MITSNMAATKKAALAEESAARVAAHLQARRTGPGRWVAKCPAHADGSPSLSVAAGRDGRVLVRCFAGCALVDVLAAAGLSMSSLFSGPPRTSQQISATLAEREQRRALDRAQRQEERSAVEWLRLHWLALEHDVPRLARRLALMEENAPGAPALTNHFHHLLAAQRCIDRALIGETE